jgi:hypothetical protein
VFPTAHFWPFLFLFLSFAACYASNLLIFIIPFALALQLVLIFIRKKKALAHKNKSNPCPRLIFFVYKKNKGSLLATLEEGKLRKKWASFAYFFFSSYFYSLFS